LKQNLIISLFLRKSDQSGFLKVFLLALLFGLNGFSHISKAQIIRKGTVDFYSSDSLLITADHYLSRPADPYILLFHRESSSRGEFDSIAERFVKMRYNCLAVDLRVGDNYGYVNNRTAPRARKKKLSSRQGIEKDIRAAISFVEEMSDEKVILLGSSLSATLALKVASEDERVKAVMAFSPGEYLRPRQTLRRILKKLTIPVYIACNPAEYPYLLEAVDGIEEGTLTLFEPPENTTQRASGMLRKSNPSYDGYWFSVLIFIKSIQN
jgi:dienelactone hydrolase